MLCGNFTIMAYALSRVDLDSSRVALKLTMLGQRTEESRESRTLEETRSTQLRPKLAKYKTGRCQCQSQVVTAFARWYLLCW